MTLTITATFAQQISEKDAVARLALALTDGVTWREDPINRADRIIDLPKISGEIELRALHATIVFGRDRLPFPDPADMSAKGDLFGRDLTTEDMRPYKR